VPPRPAQLPPALAAFAGRGPELARLDNLLAGHGAGGDDAGAVRPATVVISAISGTAGIGKTTLAVQWAHRVAARFPDGQLYVNLRGFDPAGSVMDSAEAVRGFLEAFAVPAQQIPNSLDAQVGLYRSLLADKRVLVVLDNARDAEQIRPLVPGMPGCFAIVTSRNQLTSLVATGGAHLLTLDLLSTVEARDLLSHRVGADRTAAEPSAVEAIVAGCARLPLALAIVAARAVTYPDFPLAMLATELREAASALDALRGGDPASDVRAVFAWSYNTLNGDAARLFRLLGLHPGPDLTAPAAASLAGISLEQTHALLTELTRAHLLTQAVPGRYTFHDLLRAYAFELVQTLDGHDDRRAALHRMLDHYLQSAYSAALLLEVHWNPIAATPAQPGVTVEELISNHDALGWFTAQRQVLLAAVERAAADGFDTHTWQLSWALRTFLLRQGHWHEFIAIQRTSVVSALRLGDQAAHAQTVFGLAVGLARLGRLGDAETHYRHALELYTEVDDRAGQANTYTGLADLAERQDRPADSLRHTQQALDLYRAVGHWVMVATALNNVGWYHALLGDHQQALTHCTQALTMLQDLGDQDGQAYAWDSLGYAHRGLAHYDQAATCYKHAIDLYQGLGDRYNEADTLTSLGDTHDAAGDPDAARKTWQQALDILEDLGHPDADQLSAKLHR
jgi:tetratricopeptide (TPR) repeat protein